MSIPYKLPDLNAPRFRPKRLNLLNKETYKQFIKENPKYKDSLTYEQYKKIITTYNETIWKKTIEERDGVEFPEQLGYLFVGTCPRKKKDNPDVVKSRLYGIRVQNQNWDSDNYLAKIFYTNFENKYKFKNHELWGFKAVREFKRSLSKVYRVDWKKYVMVDNKLKISLLFRKRKIKEFLLKKTEQMLSEYDEFKID